MRLPTTTPAQAANEDARVFHEALWTLTQAGERMRVPATEETIATRECWKQHGSLHSFWTRRGYSLKTRVVRTPEPALEMWLAPKVRRERVVDTRPVTTAWNQPSTRVA